MKLFQIKQDDLQRITGERTVESTAFEIALAIILIVSWVFIWFMVRHAGPTIATHFNIHGEADGFGRPVEAYKEAAIFTFVIIII